MLKSKHKRESAVTLSRATAAKAVGLLRISRGNNRLA